MTPEQLKASILQYAIQGKLVEQRPEEGNAEELYKQIQEEKQKLIKEGKIKKEKLLADITEDEIPFDIPDSWRWARIGDIYALTMGQSPDGNSVTKGTDGMEFHQGKVFFGDDYILKSDQVTTEPSKVAEAHSVLLCVRAPVGIVNITDRELCIGRGLCAIKPLAGMTEKYALYSIRCLKDIFIKKATGTTFVAITGEVVKNQLIPLPPLEEQHRIVAKIEEILPFVDRYAEAYEKLEKFNAKFPEDMKKSILQYAIMGKLVEQRPEEGTAEELYQEIQEEKQKLIKEGKIKKEKPLAEITEDEIPFDIPDSWKWIRLVDCVSILGDGLHGTPVYSVDGEYYFINGNNLDDGIINIKQDTKKVSFEEFEKYKKELNENTVLVSINGTLGNIAFYNEEKVMLGKSACYFNLIDKALKYYIYWVIKTDYFLKYATTNATGSTIKNVSLATMKSFMVPLPPLEEQHRIVAKIEELLPYCDQLLK